jgi:ankyrin repeat protein
MANFDIPLKQASIVLTLMLILFNSAKVIAADAAFCTDYVLTSIDQYWRSVDHDCGFSSKRWSANYSGQYQWCLSAHQWIAENEKRERKILLAECVVKQRASINTLFLRAIKENNVDKAKQLVEKGADITVKTQDIALIKELGMRYQKPVKIRIMDVENDIVNQTVIDKAMKTLSPHLPKKLPIAESALSFAAAKGLVDVGLWLLEQQQATLSKKEYKYYQSLLLGNGLIIAVKQENSGLVSDLLNEGASVDYELDGNNGTALYFAVLQGSEKIVRLLLDKNANVNYTQNAGENILNKALNKPTLLELLLQHNADPNSNGEAVDKAALPIMRAVDTNNVAAVDLLMQYGANADVYDYEVPYPLITVIKREQISMIGVLLKHGVNMNVIYNTTSPENCVQGEKNISPSSVALATKNQHVINLLANAKPIEMLCPAM